MNKKFILIIEDNPKDFEVLKELIENLKSNCIPLDITKMGHHDYLSFLEQRRKLMALKIKNYYYKL